MITLKYHSDCIEVHLDGAIKNVVEDIWAILEAYRDNLGTEETLKVIEAYLRHLEDELKETK